MFTMRSCAATALLLFVCFPTSDGFRGGRFISPVVNQQASSRPRRDPSFSSLGVDTHHVVGVDAHGRAWADVMLDQMQQMQQQQQQLDAKKALLMDTLRCDQEQENQELRQDIASHLGFACNPSALVISLCWFVLLSPGVERPVSRR
jgi:hypothetical protein